MKKHKHNSRLQAQNSPPHNPPRGKTTRPKNRNYVHDSYTDQAIRDGYKARSVFKLSEIDQRHKLLHPGMRVIDLGAAPGSWSRYVLQRICAGSSSKNGNVSPWLCAVDLQGLEPELQRAANLTFYQADFTSPAIQQLILSQLQQHGLFDLVLSDMAPRTTGNRTVDTGRSEALLQEVLAVLPRFLKPEGNLLFKLFQGGGEQDLQKELRNIFRLCQRLKPQAVRSQSCEIYFLCKGYLGPKQNQG